MQTYTTGGVAAGDYDGDGLVDLYVTRLDDRDILYRNRGDGTFADVTAAAFGPAHLAGVQSNGAAWGDIDNDGDLDLYVTSLFSHRFHLFVNDGAGSFSEEAVERGAATEGDDLHFGFSAVFGDYDLDGYLDLHTTEWRFLRQMTVGAQSNARLLRNLGAEAPGSFEDVTRYAGVSQHRVIAVNPLAEGQSLTSTFALLDDDLYPELVIVADHNASQLYWNRGNGRFAHGTTGARVGTDQYGMGSAVGDYDGDGRMDWFVSAIYEEGVPYRDGNRLYRNIGRGFFEDATDAAGVRDGSWGWGTTFLDYDNDGDLDLVLATGVDYADEVPYTANTTGFEDDPMRLWRNDGSGRFTEVAQQEGLTATGVGTGLAAFDLEPDGDLDLLVVHNSGRPVLYRNDTNRPGHAWDRTAGSSSSWKAQCPTGTGSARASPSPLARPSRNGAWCRYWAAATTTWARTKRSPTSAWDRTWSRSPPCRSSGRAASARAWTRSQPTGASWSSNRFRLPERRRTPSARSVSDRRLRRRRVRSSNLHPEPLGGLQRLPNVFPRGGVIDDAHPERERPVEQRRRQKRSVFPE